MDARLKPEKIALWLHPDDTTAVRASKPAQKHPLGKTIKVAHNMAMSPHAH